MPNTTVFIQWKGTNACLDFTCECGGAYHFDGFFGYAFLCPKCGAVWEMPDTIAPKRNDDFDGSIIDLKDWE